jgi:transcriptional regulator with XRE-family HTH domain
MESNNLHIGQQIAFQRKKKGFTQEQLAQLVGMKRLSIANIEQGQSVPSTKVLNNIATQLDCIVEIKLIELE